MPLIFGCVNGPQEAASTLASLVEPTQGNLVWARFDQGWFAGLAHHGRQAAWVDGCGNVWAACGERALTADRSAAGTNPYYGLSSEGELSLSGRANGVLAVFDGGRRRLSLACDWLNYFPLYYWHSGRSLLFGSHLKALSRLVGAGHDPTGVVEFLRQNWCLNGRTIFAGIRRLLPGQKIVLDAFTGALTVTETSPLWAGVAGDRPPPSDEQVWYLLVDAIRPSLFPSAVAGLMLSGGWDSRVMLAALAQVFGTASLVTATHGAPGHHELDLARRLAERLEVRHLEVRFGSDSIGRPEDLDDVLNRTDTLLFPWWRHAGSALQAAGCNVGFTGLLGEVLGGHYTVVGRGRRRRAQEVLRRAVFRSNRQVASAPDGLRRVLEHDYRERSIPFLKKEVTIPFSEEVNTAVRGDMECVVDRYAVRGIGDASRMVEAYNTEYRALDHFCQQPLMLGEYIDVALPLGSRHLVEAILAVPVPRRIHNSLSRALLAKFQPSLLGLPLAATPFVPAGAPILAQEGGRILRYSLDHLSKAVYQLSRGRVGKMRRFGWVDFERDVRSGDFLDTWRDSLTWDAIDRNAVDRYVNDIRSHQAMVRLARPILKLAYLDRMFGSR